MHDEEIKKNWLQSYPVETKVEIHWGRHGWIPGKVTRHNIGGLTVDIEVLTDPPDSMTLYILYGNRTGIRRG